VDVALAVGADGVSCGQSDMSHYNRSKETYGPEAINWPVRRDILKMWRRPQDLTPDYLGVRPVFDTTTKTDTSALVGLTGFHVIKAFYPA
jgi:thiamine-phosphate pyrophosphorylase